MPRMRKYFAALVVSAAVVTAAGCASSHPSASPESTAAASSGAPATSTATVPAGSVRLDGAVAHPVTLSIVRLRSFPARTQAVTFESKKGREAHTYVGAALTDVLASATPSVDGSAKNAALTVAVRATGSDGYQAVVSFGELSPDFGATPILLAYTEDGRPLSAPTLVVPGDIKGGRYVSDLTDLDVVDLRGR